MQTEDPTRINAITVIGDLDLTSNETELRFADGRTVRVPTAMLQQGLTIIDTQTTGLSNEGSMLIPLVEEQLHASKRIVETGKVHLKKSSEAYDVTLDEPLAVSTWKVERVPMHVVVAEAPSSRQEGSTTIYPLVEKRLIVTKELVLIEEVHVTQELSERHDMQTVTLRRETLSVECETPQQV